MDQPNPSEPMTYGEQPGSDPRVWLQMAQQAREPGLAPFMQRYVAEHGQPEIKPFDWDKLRMDPKTKATLIDMLTSNPFAGAWAARGSPPDPWLDNNRSIRR